jgi:hypothetical protein
MANPDYHLLPSSDAEAHGTKSRRCAELKRLAFKFIAVAAMISGAFAVLRFSRQFAAPCRNGAHRNHSTSRKLPSHYKLPSGDKIPSVALGVWRSGRGEVGGAVKTALQAGYRHIDGAWIYGVCFLVTYINLGEYLKPIVSRTKWKSELP